VGRSAVVGAGREGAVVGGAAVSPFFDVNRTAAIAAPPIRTRTTATSTTVAHRERELP
jgi:hypothetical protein